MPFVRRPSPTGLNLRVHSPDTEVVCAPLGSISELAVGRTFVRAARVNALRGLGDLMTLLAKTDQELKILAEYCGAEVVEHEWGLCPTPAWGEHSPNRRHYVPSQKTTRRLGIPEGHILVADVEVIRGADVLRSGEGKVVQDGINSYYAEGGLRLGDMSPRQFVSAPNEQTASAGPGNQRCLVDIEPLWVRMGSPMNLLTALHGFIEKTIQVG